MKYMVIDYASQGFDFIDITKINDEATFVTFRAEAGNPSYDQFLVDAKLTDKQVKALKPDVWYDFPEGDK